MSDTPFQAPDSAQSSAPASTLPMFVFIGAIVAIVFGVIGVILGCMGVAGLAAQGAVVEAAVATQPPGARDAYRALMDAQMTLAPLSGGMAVLSMLISGFMVVAGGMAVASRQVGLLSVAAFAAAGIDVLMILVSLVTQLYMWPAMSAYIEAVADIPGAGAGATGGAIGGLIGVAVSVIIYLALAGFWVKVGLDARALD